MSSDTMSPDFIGVFDGMPWITCAFTDAHSVAG
jgi:hypothetical protein